MASEQQGRLWVEADLDAAVSIIARGMVIDRVPIFWLDRIGFRAMMGDACWGLNSAVQVDPPL